ncbi:unnamed protein product [Darwinula stevensoni]|uniref:Dihydropteridine reductase n=1 Tax=Darwinula stevensoni TaxID=69355 RepID=A0A7R8X5E1_9CRUS|nr:unnamed protein product [Darwinula stevensoni]CAG0886524.1 unnamed protein product [Darwinula stevensoni]
MKRVLVYGGRGALGNACISHFKNSNWWVGNIDVSKSDQADANITVNPEESWVQQEASVVEALQQVLGGGGKVDAILCVAGGWAGGNAASKEMVKNADAMWRTSVWPSTVAAHLGAHFLNEGGMVAFCGAKAALEGTPGMIGYGMAKAAVHHLVKSLAAEKSGLPSAALPVAVCPVTLDTPMNRKFMPKADVSTWTPLFFVAELFHNWAEGKERPVPGSLIQLITKDGQTSLIPA